MSPPTADCATGTGCLPRCQASCSLPHLHPSQAKFTELVTAQPGKTPKSCPAVALISGFPSCAYSADLGEEVRMRREKTTLKKTTHAEPYPTGTCKPGANSSSSPSSDTDNQSMQSAWSTRTVKPRGMLHIVR